MSRQVTPHGSEFPQKRVSLFGGSRVVFWSRVQTYWWIGTLNTAEGCTVALLTLLYFSAGRHIIDALSRKRRVDNTPGKQNDHNFISRLLTTLPLLLQDHHHPYTANNRGSWVTYHNRPGTQDPQHRLSIPSSFSSGISPSSTKSTRRLRICQAHTPSRAYVLPQRNSPWPY